MASSMLGGETPRVNPGLAGADRGADAAKEPACQGRRISCCCLG